MMQEYEPKVYDLPVQFGKRLRKYIKQEGMTQEEFALQLGIASSILSHWLNGNWLPNVTSLFRICRMTGLSADYLIGIGEDYGKDIGD